MSCRPAAVARDSPCQTRIAVTEEFGDEAFIPNPDWLAPGVAYIWYSLPGGYLKFKK